MYQSRWFIIGVDGTVHIYSIVHLYNTIYIYGTVYEYGGANGLYLGGLVACAMVWIYACLGKFCHKGDKSLRRLGFKWDRCDPSSLF